MTDDLDREGGAEEGVDTSHVKDEDIHDAADEEEPDADA